MLQVPLEQGQIESITVANPSAGSGWSFLLPQNFRYKLDSIFFLYVADANAADRQFDIDVSTVGGIQRSLTFNQLVVANDVHSHTFLAGAPDLSQVAPLIMSHPLPLDLILSGNTNIVVSTVNIQVGDQFSSINLGLRKWPIQTV